MKIFDPDGFVMAVLGKLSDLVFLNITFVIFCLPVFTIGAAVTALYECTFSLLEDTEDSLVPRQFFHAFKRNFKRGTAAWGISLLPILFLLAYAWVIRSFDGILGNTYKITMFMLVFLFAMGFQYVFALIAQTNMSMKNVWKNGWILAVAALPWSVLNLVMVVGLTLIFTMVLPSGTSVYLWAFLFFALINYFSAMIFHHVFKKYVYKEQEEEVNGEI